MGTHIAKLTWVSDHDCNKQWRNCGQVFMHNHCHAEQYSIGGSFYWQVCDQLGYSQCWIRILSLWIWYCLCYSSGLVQKVHVVSLVQKSFLAQFRQTTWKLLRTRMKTASHTEFPSQVFVAGNVHAHYLPNTERGWWQVGYVGTFSSIRFVHTLSSQCWTWFVLCQYIWFCSWRKTDLSCQLYVSSQ